MTRRVYLHVGPPKTGTTSLQLALQEAELPGFSYVGTHQPRADYPDDKVKLLIQLARGDNLTAEERARLRAAFELPLRAGQALIISEEMLTVDKTEAAIRARLARTIAYFREELGCSIRVIFTLRDPSDALPSYYQEIFRSLPSDLASKFSEFARDGRAFCYDYAALIDHARACGAEAHVIEFHQLASGNISLGNLLGADSDITASLHIGKANPGNKNGTSRVLPAITLAQRMRGSRLRRILHRMGLNRVPGYRAMALRIGGMAVQPTKMQELALPPDVLQHYTKSLMQARETRGSGSSA